MWLSLFASICSSSDEIVARSVPTKRVQRTERRQLAAGSDVDGQALDPFVASKYSYVFLIFVSVLLLFFGGVVSEGVNGIYVFVN